MAYQTFKPNMYVSERTTVKIEDHHNSRSTIQNQTQLIEILRGSLESKMDQEELWEIMEQVQGMSREQHIDLYALVSQLYEEMKRDNQLNQQVEALNSQIEIYVREITELKMEREEFNYKSRYIINLSIRFKKNEQVQQLEDENQSLKRQLEITELERDSLQTAQSQLDKKVSRLSSHLRTEENEREELVREKQQLRQQLMKTQLQENQKLEAQLSLRQQELDFCQAKALQAEQQVHLYQTENLSLQKQIGTFKYQLEQQEIQYHQNISSIQSELQQLSDHYQNQTMALEEVQESALNSERFISEIISQLQQITQINSDDIFELLENIQANVLQKCQFKQQDDEKSQIIFDLQHKYSDKVTQNETLISQNQQLQQQLDTTLSDLKQLEKQRRIFKSEYSHLKQLLDQKVQECQSSQERFKQLEQKMHSVIERSLKVEQEVAKLEEEKQYLCQNQMRQQSATIHKKSQSTTSDIARQDYQAILQTFEKIKPLFTPTQQDLVDDMLQLQKILVKKDLNLDLKDLLQQELKLQQMIHLHSLNQNQQKQQVNRLNQENRKLRLELSGTVSSSNRQTENSILKDRKYNQSMSIK